MYGSARKYNLQILDLYIARVLGFVLERLYVDAHEPSLGSRRAKSSHCPKHPTHDTVFDNKYMKLFDARPNSICTFALLLLLTASNIDISDILETFSYFVLQPLCIKPPKIVMDLVNLKKDRTVA